VPFLKAEAGCVLFMNQPARRTFLTGLKEPNSNWFHFNGSPVCYRFLEKAFGFSRDTMGSVRGTPGSRVVLNPQSAGRDCSSSQRDSVVCYLERLAESTADFMPDSDETHLPYFQKVRVYEMFVLEFKRLYTVEPPSESYFYETWRLQCPKIKVCKVHRFTKCEEGETLRDALARAGTDERATVGLRARRREHVNMVKKERREYQKKTERATLYPDKYCSLIVDGADQTAFGLPHFTFNTKATAGHSLKVKLVGVLEHGPVKGLSLYTMTAEFETGANHIIEALHRTLSVKAGKTALPDVLYLQVDNCTRENKNRFMFCYMESLVAWGVFTDVFVSFLPIGHTHADIDQTFSCTSRRLRTNDATTMGDLIEQLRKSYSPQPAVTRMLHLANFSGLVSAEK